MLILLSPAKNLDFESDLPDVATTKPVFAKRTAELAEVAKKLSRADLRRLMGISEKLADLNHERFQAFRTSGRIPGARPAALAFAGDVYQGLDAKTLDTDDLEHAQGVVRILSGLYGLLRPLDAIQPYRLEMGTRLKNPEGGDLYAFWGDAIAKEIDRALKGHDDPRVVNLASNEYFKAVDRKALKAPVVSPVFKEEKDGRMKSLMYYAKRARGMMARWAVETRAARAEDLKDFDAGGYRFQPKLSEDGEWVFARPQPAAKAA